MNKNFKNKFKKIFAKKFNVFLANFFRFFIFRKNFIDKSSFAS